MVVPQKLTLLTRVFGGPDNYVHVETPHLRQPRSLGGALYCSYGSGEVLRR
jgi:hypothetical protein